MRDDDYVDDSFTTNNDVANEEEYMKGLEEENSDDDITSPGYSRVTATNQKDAKSAATNEEGAIGSAVEKGEATSKKDADIGEKELENDIDCRVTGVEIKEGTDMPNTVNGDEDDAVDNILTDTPVDAGVKATGTAEARTPVSSAQDGDDDTVAGGDGDEGANMSNNGDDNASVARIIVLLTMLLLVLGFSSLYPSVCSGRSNRC